MCVYLSIYIYISIYLSIYIYIEASEANTEWESVFQPTELQLYLYLSKKTNLIEWFLFFNQSYSLRCSTSDKNCQ